MYVCIWVILIAFTVFEVVMLMMPLVGTVIVLSIAGIAAFKALTIVLFYQHIRYEQDSLKVLPVAIVVLIIIFMIMAIALHGPGVHGS